MYIVKKIYTVIRSYVATLEIMVKFCTHYLNDHANKRI